MDAKKQFERTGRVFPSDPRVDRVLIFGNSKILAGFLPALFDRLAAAGGMNVSSFNSGFPGSDEFLPELEDLCQRGQAPNVLLMTLPWKPDPAKRDIFHLIRDDHAVVGQLFPFRFWLRDFTNFLMTADNHGGARRFYQESRGDARQVLDDRGYYLITEQSRFSGGRIPDDFKLATDQPGKVERRVAPPPGGETKELNRLLQRYHIRCYFVPYYLRAGEAAAPTDYDTDFARAVEGATSCKLAGPDYFLYPNRLFSDQTHLNTIGARVYTQALFDLLRTRLDQGREHALQ